MEFQDKIDQLLLSQGHRQTSFHVSVQPVFASHVPRTTCHIPRIPTDKGRSKANPFIWACNPFLCISRTAYHVTHTMQFLRTRGDPRQPKPACPHHVSMSSDFQCPTPSSSHAVPPHRILQSIYNITRPGNRRKHQGCERKASRRRRI